MDERKAKPKRPVEGHFNYLDEKQWGPQPREWIQDLTGGVTELVHLTVCVCVCVCVCAHVCVSLLCALCELLSTQDDKIKY